MSHLRSSSSSCDFDILRDVTDTYFGLNFFMLVFFSSTTLEIYFELCILIIPLNFSHTYRFYGLTHFTVTAEITRRRRMTVTFSGFECELIEHLFSCYLPNCSAVLSSRAE